MLNRPQGLKAHFPAALRSYLTYAYVLPLDADEARMDCIRRQKFL